MKWRIRYFAAAMMLCGFASSASASALSIARQGYFFVGGSYIKTPAGTVLDGQMYVQYQIPERRTYATPVVMVHGQGQSGTNFLGTPDGREGWADQFLRKGYAVYVVDQAMRGRSGYHAEIDGPAKPFPVEAMEKYFTHPEGAPPWPEAIKHNQWPGAGVRGDATFDQFYASQLASTSDVDVRMDEKNRDDLIALLQKIGPSILLTHSRSGSFGWVVGDARPDLVKAIVAVEPWGPPFKEKGTTAVSPFTRPWGLSVVPLAFAPAVSKPEELQPRQDTADKTLGEPCWRIGGDVHRSLPRLGRVPVLLVTGEASYHAGYDRCTSQFLSNAGVANEWMQLGAMGIHGNNHMMMLEKNNGAIADAIAAWLKRTLPR